MTHLIDPYETGKRPQAASQTGLKGVQHTQGMANPFAPSAPKTTHNESFTLWAFELPQETTPTEATFPTEELASIAQYVDHIVQKHHGYTRAALNSITPMISHVAQTKGKDYPEFKALDTLFDHFKKELLSHLWQEETVIFPACIAMESQGTIPQSFTGRIKNPLSLMQSDHTTTTDMTGQIHHLLSTMVAPEHACDTYRQMTGDLWHLLDDLTLHTYKEDQILFPRVWTLREQLL